MFLVSLIAMVVVHMIPYLGISGSTTNLGPMEISTFIALPLAVAAFLLWYARQAHSNGLIR